MALRLTAGLSFVAHGMHASAIQQLVCRARRNQFRSVEAAKSLRGGADNLLCEPTVLLPSRHNIMALARRIEKFSGISAEVKQQITWAKRRLNNGGNQYDLRTHLEARKKAAEVTRQSPSLLGQFLSQTEPPQRCIQSRDSDEVQTDSESGRFGSESEEIKGAFVTFSWSD